MSEPPADAAPTGQVRPVDLRDYVDFDPAAARRVRVFATERLALDLWCIEPQQATPVLRYDDADVTYSVVGGRSWFVTEQGEIGLDALGAMLVPAGVIHGIDNRGADPLIVVASAAPPRDHDEDAPVVREMAAVRDDASTSVGTSLRTAFRRLLGDG